MANRILPPDAARIAQEVGGTIKELYDNTGLTCYREETTVGLNIMVREGYLQSSQLPNGKVILIKKMTKLITRKEAEENA